MESTLVINPTQNGIYIVENGKVTKISAPSTNFGKTEITWRHGKVAQVDSSETTKF